MSLKSERVILVTGASRGIGRGTAVALAAPGTTIYVTGRTTRAGTEAALPRDHPRNGCRDCAPRRPEGIAVACDHADDAQVAALFAQIAARRRGGWTCW